MTNITLILYIMQSLDYQLHGSRIGLITAFIYGILYTFWSALSSIQVFTLSNIIAFTEGTFSLNFVIHSLIGGSIAYIGGFCSKFIVEKVLKYINRKKDNNNK